MERDDRAAGHDQPARLHLGGVRQFSILQPDETVAPDSEAWRAVSITVSDDRAVGGMLAAGMTRRRHHDRPGDRGHARRGARGAGSPGSSAVQLLLGPLDQGHLPGHGDPRAPGHVLHRQGAAGGRRGDQPHAGRRHRTVQHGPAARTRTRGSSTCRASARPRTGSSSATACLIPQSYPKVTGPVPSTPPIPTITPAPSPAASPVASASPGASPESDLAPPSAPAATPAVSPGPGATAAGSKARSGGRRTGAGRPSAWSLPPPSRVADPARLPTARPGPPGRAALRPARVTPRRAGSGRRRPAGRRRRATASRPPSSARVQHPRRRRPQALDQAGLCRHPLVSIAGRRPARRSAAPAGSSGSQVTSHTSSHSRGEAALDELDRLDRDRRRTGPLGRLDRLEDPRPDRRVDDRLEVPQRRRIGEHEPAKGRPVQGAVRSRHGRTEPAQDRRRGPDGPAP